MREKEQKLWDRMRHALKDKLYMERIENVVSPGRPDVDVMLYGITIPIELKAIDSWPVKENTPVLGAKGLNQNQLNWWLTWKRWGGTGFIIVSVGLDLFIVPSQYSDELNSMNQSTLKYHKTDWLEVYDLVLMDVKNL